jgi:hypothetical protein
MLSCNSKIEISRDSLRQSLLIIFVYFSSKRRQVSRIFRHMPHVSEEAIKEAFPDVDIDKARDHKEALGNHEKNVA